MTSGQTKSDRQLVSRCDFTCLGASAQGCNLPVLEDDRLQVACLLPRVMHCVLCNPKDAMAALQIRCALSPDET